MVSFILIYPENKTNHRNDITQQAEILLYVNFRSELGPEENLRVQICRHGEFWTWVAEPGGVWYETDMQSEDLQCVCRCIHAAGIHPLLQSGLVIY